MATYHRQQQHQQEAPEFGTVLAARDKSEPPTELEIALRHCCHRIRVVSTLQGGAHFLIKASDASIAIRVYGANDAIEVEKKWQESAVDPEQWTTKFVPQCPTEGRTSTESGDRVVQAQGDDGGSGGDNGDDAFVSGLQTFRDSFMHAAVFFVLPPGEMQREQLGNARSFLSVAQRALVSTKWTPLQEDLQSNPNRKRPTGSSRVFIVPDTKALRIILKSVVDSIKPEKRALKEKFFAAQRKANFHPNPETGLPVSEDAVASRVAGAFRSWAERFGLPHGEADVIMSVLGSLGNIASADKAALDNVPIGEETKKELLDFFACTPSSLADISGSARDDDRYTEDPNSNRYGTESQTFAYNVQHPIDPYSVQNTDISSRLSLMERLPQYLTVPNVTQGLAGLSNIPQNVVEFTPMNFQSSSMNPNYGPNDTVSAMSGVTYRQQSPYGSSRTGRSLYQSTSACSNGVQLGREGQGYGTNFQACARNDDQFVSGNARGPPSRPGPNQRVTDYVTLRNHSGYYR